MIAFASMLVPAAEKAGMSVPDNADRWQDSRDEHLHFFVFCLTQLARRMEVGEHWDNAEVIASIPAEELKKMTVHDLVGRGLSGIPRVVQ